VNPHGIAEVDPGTPLETMIRLIEGPSTTTWPAGWEDWEVTRQAHYVASQRFLDRLPACPADRFRGRGIVIAGGGIRYFPSVYVTVRAIRMLGCTLPVQIWYFGRHHEMPDSYQDILAPFGVQCVDADAVREEHPFRILNGWELKVFAVLHSPFEEVLSLDADCYPVSNPEILFDVPEYREKGASFWPDYPTGAAPDWDAFQVPPTGHPPIESGQFLIHKRKCWRAFRLACWLNEHSDWSYLHGYGDKNTFEVAWARCGVPYHQYGDFGHWSTHGYEHIGPDDKLLFIHRCKDKFRFDNYSVYSTNQSFEINAFRAELPLERECFGWIEELKRKLGMPLSSLEPGRSPPMNPLPKLTIKAFMYTCPARQAIWEGTMIRWRQTDWGEDPVVIHDDATGPTSADRIVANAHRMLLSAWDDPADAYLFLEDDLMFNSHLRANLENWAPLRQEGVVIASLCNFGFPLRTQIESPLLWQQREVMIAPDVYHGGQGIVLSRQGLRVVLDDWDQQPHPYDIRLGFIAAEHCGGMRMYSPSLVQHLSFPSTCGSGEARAVDFDPWFRATPRVDPL